MPNLKSRFFFQALSTDSIERLPVYNKAAWKHYNTNHEADDWCVPSREPKDMTTFRSAQTHLIPLENPDVAFALNLEGMVFRTTLYQILHVSFSQFTIWVEQVASQFHLCLFNLLKDNIVSTLHLIFSQLIEPIFKQLVLLTFLFRVDFRSVEIFGFLREAMWFFKKFFYVCWKHLHTDQLGQPSFCFRGVLPSFIQ